MVIYKTPSCGCCTAWGDRLQAAGFDVTFVERDDLAEVRKQHGIPEALASCHTGISAGYAFEGHVPAADVLRLLTQRPRAVGLAAPGMPAGSPGMETPGGAVEAYDVLLVLPDGSSRVYARRARSSSN